MQDIVKVLMSIISDPPIWENDTLESSGEDMGSDAGQPAFLALKQGLQAQTRQ